MKNDYLFIVKKYFDENFIDYTRHLINGEKDLQKAYLEYIMLGAKDIAKTAKQMLENMENSNN